MCEAPDLIVSVEKEGECRLTKRLKLLSFRDKSKVNKVRKNFEIRVSKIELIAILNQEPNLVLISTVCSSGSLKGNTRQCPEIFSVTTEME